jgi:phosphoribosylformylglycinamidine synthase
MQSIQRFAADGGLVFGICNGFQVLCEARLLPGALISNRSLSFICERVAVRVEETATAFTRVCAKGDVLRLPIKHGAGCYVADADTLRRLEDNGQVVLRYVDGSGRATEEANPNGSLNNIAGVVNERRNVFGLMPHPEHACDKLVGSEDGAALFRSVKATVQDGRPAESAPVAPGP